MRVVYWNSIPSPYMVDRFNAVADRGELDFEVWFTDRTHPDRSWTIDESTWRFRYRYLPSVAVLGRRLRLPSPLLQRARPDLLVMLYGEPVYVVGFVLAKLRRMTTMFWAEVTFDSWFRRTALKERLKRLLFSNVDAILTVGADGQRHAERYGVPRDTIHLAPHVVDAAHFTSGAELARGGREQLRRELGIEGTCFIYVGRLWSGKGLDTLLDGFARVAEPSSLLLLGDGPDETRLRERCEALGLGNVVFAGFKQHDELPRWFAAADVFVFPTLGDPYGLVVDEAMASGLPVISTSAAGEIGLRVEDGVTGFIVPPGDSATLARRLTQLAADPELRARFGTAGLTKIAGSSPARWAADFERAALAVVGGRAA
jgi:glycosyltransferase involved in cell wall biosynthesis